MNVEKISAITIKVNDMARSVHFYNRLLGLKVLYGGESGPIREKREGYDRYQCREDQYHSFHGRLLKLRSTQT